jgi:hypothetical protein
MITPSPTAVIGTSLRFAGGTLFGCWFSICDSLIRVLLFFREIVYEDGIPLLG